MLSDLKTNLKIGWGLKRRTQLFWTNNNVNKNPSYTNDSYYEWLVIWIRVPIIKILVFKMVLTMMFTSRCIKWHNYMSIIWATPVLSKHDQRFAIWSKIKSKYELTALLRFVGGLEVDADDDDGDELQILHL